MYEIQQRITGEWITLVAGCSTLAEARVTLRDMCRDNPSIHPATFRVIEVRVYTTTYAQGE